MMKQRHQQRTFRRLALVALWLTIGLRALGGEAPPVMFGVAADIQYGDKEPRPPRVYTDSPAKLAECVGTFNARPLAFVIQLGDLVDGYDKNPARSLQDLDRILPVLRRIKAPLYHVIGNHDMLCGREALTNRLGLAATYYDFKVAKAPGWRFVVLDGNESGWNTMGAAQMQWLKETLAKATAAGERVICFSHYPRLMPGNSPTAQQGPVMKLLRKSPCVAAWFAGHEHGGGYVLDQGIHYLTFKGMVQNPSNAFAVVTLTDQSIKVEGFGAEPSRDLPLAAGARSGAAAAEKQAPSPSRFAKEIEAFAAQDRTAPPQKGGIVFVGSSSVRMMDIGKWLPGLKALNRGFGGAHISDVNHYLEETVLRYEPATVVFYCGGNDLWDGKTPEQVKADMDEFRTRLFERVPAARLILLAIRPSPQRFRIRPIEAQFNTMLSEMAAADRRIVYLSGSCDRYLDEAGRPRPELFVGDGLHMSDAGYRIWAEILSPVLRVSAKEEYP